MSEAASNKRAGPSKAEIKARLPELIQNARTSREAAVAALRACIDVRHPIPETLLSPETLADAFDARRLVLSFDKLCVATQSIDISSAIKAIRVAVAKTPTPQALRRVAKAIPAKLLGITAQHEGKRRPAEFRKASRVLLTPGTISDIASLGMWLLRRLSQPNTPQPNKLAELALEWMEVVRAAALEAASTKALIAAITFAQSLTAELGPSIGVRLKADSKYKRGASVLEGAVQERAKAALLRSELGDLDELFRLVSSSPERQAALLTTLRDLCETRGPDLSREAIDWVERHATSPVHSAPVAEDESQSASLDYVSTCLLSTWSASSEGERSKEAFEAVTHLAEDLFNVRLVGTPGDVVRYDERRHELSSSEGTLGEVEIIRPAVVWADGVRTRILVRALSKAAGPVP